MTDYVAKHGYHGQVADHYDSDRFTSWRGRWIDGREKRSITRALERVTPGARILDLPCGTGRITQHLLRLGYRVTGGDVSESMIALARERIGQNPRLDGFVQVDAEKIDLPDDHFDCVTSVRLMGHLPDDIKLCVLREMARVARRYVVVTFYMAGPLRSLKWVLKKRQRLSKSPWWHPSKHRDLRRLFVDCGLRPVAKFPVAPVVSDGITLLLEPLESTPDLPLCTADR